MMAGVEAFHFLRPAWLLLLLPAAAVVWGLWRQGSALERWRGVVAPHLLEHLVVRPRRQGRVRPLHLFAMALTLAILALAGPSWRREPPPFVEDTALLVIAMDLSESMLATDVQPSRLERGQQKVRDLLEERKGARTALVAYAGSAHTVLPLTDDPGLLAAYAMALSPMIMPQKGKDPAAALALAATLLEKEAAPGTLLFVTDGIPAAAAGAFEEHRQASRDQVAVLALGTERGGADLESLEELSSKAGVQVTPWTMDDRDVRQVLGGVARHFESVVREDETSRWRDEGWWLLWPVALLVLAWFRKGWTLQWET
jgi:Ca-activated chloride channel family protein